MLTYVEIILRLAASVYAIKPFRTLIGLGQSMEVVVVSASAKYIKWSTRRPITEETNISRTVLRAGSIACGVGHSCLCSSNHYFFHILPHLLTDPLRIANSMA